MTALAATAPALAQDAAERATALNVKALERFDALDPEGARKLLKEALDICENEGLATHKIKARTHIHFGIVLFSGFDQREIAARQFRKALEIDPDMRLTKKYSGPDIQAAFDAVKRDLAANPPAATDEMGDPSPAAPPAPAPPAPAEPEGLSHQTIGEWQRGTVLPVRATVGRDIKFEKVVLAYRPDGAEQFLARDMTKQKDGAYAAEVPIAATAGSTVAYYIEVRDADGQPVAASGSPTAPNIVVLTDKPPPVAAGGKDTADAGEAPAAGVKAVAQSDDESEEGGEEGDEEAETTSGGIRERLFGRIAIGSGVGWIHGRPEVNAVSESGRAVRVLAGFAPAQLMHVAPEVGYYVRPELAVSLQLRLQIISGVSTVRAVDCPGAGGSSDGKGICKPAPGAFAVFARGTRWFNEWAAQRFKIEKLRPYLSVLLGGGEIRHVVNLPEAISNCGEDGTQPCNDTVRASVLMLGGGAGLAYDLTEAIAITAAADLQLAVPATSLNLDFNLGVSFGF